jgi:hypothetical protein
VLCAGFNSYIIGTITLVVMKGDERTGHYRRCANNLKQYSKVNSVPKVKQDVSLDCDRQCSPVINTCMRIIWQVKRTSELVFVCSTETAGEYAGPSPAALQQRRSVR